MHLTTNDYICLVAAIATILALPPAYQNYFKKNKEEKLNRTKIQSEGTNAQTEIVEKQPMPAFMKAFVCVAFAAAILVIELIAFSWILSIAGIEFNLDTMPVNWKIGFYAMFAIPGISCFIALLHISSTFSD